MTDGVGYAESLELLVMTAVAIMAVDLGYTFPDLLDTIADNRNDFQPLEWHTLLALTTEWWRDPTERQPRSLYEYHSSIENAPVTAVDQWFEMPWFQDGLDDEEKARIIAGLAYGEDILAPHLVRMETVESPLAGNINVWYALRPSATRHYESLPGFVEEAVIGMEQLIGTSFPMSEVIVLTDPELRIDRREMRWGIMSVADGLDDEGLRRAVYNTVSGYYYGAKIIPLWFVGSVDFAVLRMEDWFGYEDLDSARARAAEEAEAECRDNGITNLYATAVYDPGLSPEALYCAVILGREFLLDLHSIVGDEAMTAILGELYPPEGFGHSVVLLSSSEELFRATEDEWLEADREIYDVVMKHADQSGNGSEVRDLYEEKHGGPFPY